MDELYLIAHKVRSELAFDIAQRVVIGDEDVWFIPTSGHRAYPLRWQPLTETLAESFSAEVPDNGCPANGGPSCSNAGPAPPDSW
jgi:hypothetical protein